MCWHSMRLLRLKRAPLCLPLVFLTSHLTRRFVLDGSLAVSRDSLFPFLPTFSVSLTEHRVFLSRRFLKALHLLNPSRPCFFASSYRPRLAAAQLCRRSHAALQCARPYRHCAIGLTDTCRSVIRSQPGSVHSFRHHLLLHTLPQP